MFQVFHIEKLIYKHQNPNKYQPAFIRPVNQLILTLYISRVKIYKPCQSIFGRVPAAIFIFRRIHCILIAVPGDSEIDSTRHNW
jgi:hypothetical protein